MAAHGFVPDLSPTDYAHLLQGGRLKNGRIGGTILEIGEDYAETTRVKGTVSDGETKVHTSTHRETMREAYKNVFEAAQGRRGEEGGSKETTERDSLFGEEKKPPGPHTILLVSNNLALGNAESCLHKLRRYGLHSLVALVLLLLYIGGSLLCAKLEMSLLWYSVAYVISSVALLPVILYLLSLCIII